MAAVCIASGWWRLSAAYGSPARQWEFAVADGRLQMQTSTIWGVRGVGVFLARSVAPWEVPQWKLGWSMIGLGGRGLEIDIPLWAPLSLIAAGAAWLWRRPPAREPNACARCGYDLSAIPVGPCPECGGARESLFNVTR